MEPERKLELATRYVAWLRRRWFIIALASVLVLAGSVWLIAFHLPLHADFAHLLPPDAPAVRDLRRLEGRVEAQDAMLVLVISEDPAQRAAAAAEMTKRARAIDHRLVTRVEDDDKPIRDFLRARRHLFVPLEDLQAARAALAKRIEQAKLEANPLYIAIDEEVDEKEAAETARRLDDLRAKRQEAESRLDRSSFISADGKTQLIIVRTSFPKTNVAASRVLLDRLERERKDLIAAYPKVDIGFAGGNVVTLAEHDALQRGIVLSSLVTAGLVAIVLLLYFRSVRLLFVLGGVLVVATTLAFGLAVFTVGHLNAATAFLGAIIAGNGVNYGILLIARYLEDRRMYEPDDAMARALSGTLRPTLVASLGAAIAYGSLAATSFRGFADFAIIGSVGMIVCWIATYVTLPALVLRLVPRPRMKVGAPVVGSALAWLLAFKHPWRVVAVASVLAVGGVWVTYGYIKDDPFEYNIRNLRSAGKDAELARAWMNRSDAAFGRGIAGQTFIATDSIEEVRQVVAALEHADRKGPKTIGKVRSILEVLPDDQPAKLHELAAIRELLADDALEALPEDQYEELMSLRPPENLQPITVETLPPELLETLRERDGRIGLLIGVRPDLKVDEWNGKDLVRFANAVRRIELEDGRTVTTSGASVVFADILAAIQHDGLRVTAVAALGLLLMVLLVVGPNLRALSVMVATVSGALGLVAVCALLDIKVNFLDFIALPITLGLGIDYAINVAHRHHGEDHDPVQTLRTSGSAVFVCSLTTIIGYGSLLVSENLAIRGFGLASLIGEICCLVTALVLVPAIVSLRRPSRAPSQPAVSV